jgi:hypothetical protein
MRLGIVPRRRRAWFAVEMEVGFVDHEHGLRRGGGDGEQMLAADVAPVGLLGEATMISLVFGVMAARKRSKGKAQGVVGLHAFRPASSGR